MIFQVLDRTEMIVASFDSENIINYSILNATLSEKLNDSSTLSLTVVGECDGSEYLVEENFIYFIDTEDNPQLFIIKKVDEERADEHVITISGEHCKQELIDEIFNYSMYGITLQPSVLLGQILSGTRWEVGNVATIGSTHPCVNNSDQITVLEAIYNLADDYSLDVRFRLVTDGVRITHRYVDMLTIIGRNTGKRFEYKKDIVSVKRTVDTSSIKTAIIPVGGTDESPLDIRSITWTKPTNPLNKPAGQKYLEDSTATARYGYKGSNGMRPRYIRVKDSSAKTATELINNAYTELQKYTAPKITYELDVLDLYQLTQNEDLIHEKVQLGDNVIVLDSTFKPPIMLTAIVNERTVDLLYPANNSIKLGGIKDTIADTLNKQKDSINTVSDTISKVSNDLNSAKASISNLNGELELKVEKGDVKSIIEQSPTEVNVGFNGISQNITMSADGLKVLESNGDYTLLNASGVRHFTSSSNSSYHYLSNTGVFIATAGNYTGWISIPNEYKGKNFTVIVSAGSLQNLTTGWYLQTFECVVTDYDYANGKFKYQAKCLVSRVADVNQITSIDFQVTYVVIA